LKVKQLQKIFFNYGHHFNTSVVHTENLTLIFWGENAHSYNRFMYARNNPLIYTDPDGEWINFVIGAIIGGFSNVIMNAKNIDNTGQFFAYFGIGAAAGALGAGVGSAVSSAIGGVGAIASTASGA
jgi:hypothetical protein